MFNFSIEPIGVAGIGGRGRSCLLQDEAYLPSCMRYIELSPVKAGMVAHLGEYRWSSYRVHAQGESLGVIEPHGVYDQWAEDLAERQEAYRELFCYALESGPVHLIRQATNGNVVLGNNPLSEEISRMLGRQVTHGRAGRPKKSATRPGGTE